MTAFTPDNVLLPIHGRRLGLVGDGQSTSVTGLNVDGKLVATNRCTGLFFKLVSVGNNGAGAVIFAGLLVGDLPFLVLDLTDLTDVTSSFEAAISVAGQIQQTAATNLSAKTLLILVHPNAVQ
jgi:hypothetical protein